MRLASYFARILAAALLFASPLPALAAYGGPGTTQGAASGGPGDLMFCSVVTTAPSYTNAQNYACTMTIAGAVRVDGSATTQPVSRGNDSATSNGAWAVAPYMNTSGGVALFSRIPSSAASTNATFVATGAHKVAKIFACNTTTTPARIKFYDSTTNPPVPGTTTVKFSRPIPAAAAAGGLACASYDEVDFGWTFITGLGYAITTGPADSDTTAVAAGAITDLSVEYQ